MQGCWSVCNGAWLWELRRREGAGLRDVGLAVGALLGGRTAGRRAGCARWAPLTSAGLVSRDVLGPQPLVQDVKHLPAQVQEEQR